MEHSQRSLEKVQKTVDKATLEIHQTINEKLSDLKTLEKKLSKSNLLEHDANNNDVEKSTAKAGQSISRHSTKHDLAGQVTSTQKTDTATTSNTNTTQVAAADTTKSGTTAMNMEKDRMSVNAISVAPSQERGSLEHQESEDSNQMNSSTR